ncbi:hypothetical protein BDK51DRAFT_43766 [Blyttiomyces helicus]|uniref:Uncharacterized protein n=1 Tax=Blyttiomyces helicus TaxID=388810 RepID=A0A4P9VVY1_9FUNG|nr:hypothetical protein BDK51DRAFT_43766 [Blyttiomyces helicus]|eukprot:RKO83005.1 hypothetical protein BDK51DRAFT_43766 [Blyttiomyces helicus]
MPGVLLLPFLGERGDKEGQCVRCGRSHDVSLLPELIGNDGREENHGQPNIDSSTVGRSIVTDIRAKAFEKGYEEDMRKVHPEYQPNSRGEIRKTAAKSVDRQADQRSSSLLRHRSRRDAYACDDPGRATRFGDRERDCSRSALPARRGVTGNLGQTLRKGLGGARSIDRTMSELFFLPPPSSLQARRSWHLATLPRLRELSAAFLSSFSWAARCARSNPDSPPLDPSTPSTSDSAAYASPCDASLQTPTRELLHGPGPEPLGVPRRLASPTEAGPAGLAHVRA